ncbi:hypothetical protein CAZ12_34210, partial [Pseudomonas aeruginosa]
MRGAQGSRGLGDVYTRRPLRHDLAEFRREAGEALLHHCRFETLQAHLGAGPDWRRWPEPRCACCLLYTSDSAPAPQSARLVGSRVFQQKIGLLVIEPRSLADQNHELDALHILRCIL